MRHFIILLLLGLVAGGCKGTDKLYFKVKANEWGFLDCPVVVDLSGKDLPDPGRLALFEETSGEPRKVAFQYAFGQTGEVLWFVMPGKLDIGEERTFYLEFMPESARLAGRDPVRMKQTKDELVIRDNDAPILSYRVSEKMPPEGVDSLYRRSAYIHPLWSPSGEVLTQIQPSDHYHHYGIWGPWTKTHINGREIDYWNLGKGQGTVRFSGFHFIESGEVFGIFSARQDHIDFGAGVPERVTMEEDYYVRYWRVPGNADRYILDIRTAFTNVLEDTILFDAYRYGGGLGYRARADWGPDNSTVLTSEGLTQDEADGTRAKWCMIGGEVEEAVGKVAGERVGMPSTGRAGILFLSHPDNREHPEPMRVWPTSNRNRQIFFEFCPIRHKEWVIEPGKEYALQYRLVVFDGEMSPEEAGMYWNGFAHQPEIAWVARPE